MAKKKVKKGNKIPLECLEKAQDALHAFSEDELKSYVIDVIEKSKSYKNRNMDSAIEEAIQEVSNSKMKDLLGRAATKARNIEKFDKIAKDIKEGKLSIRNYLIRTTKNKDYNIQNAQQTSKFEMQTEVYSSLTTEEMKEFQLGSIDDEIAAAASGKKVANPIAQKLGDILRKYPEEIRNPRMIASDALAYEEINPNRFLRPTHDKNKLVNAGQSISERYLSKNKVDVDTPKIVWAQDIKAELNIEETAKRLDAYNLDGSVDMGKFDRAVDRIYDNIIESKSDVFAKSNIASDLDAIRRLRRQTFVFKDWESFQRYNKKYGQGTLFEALQSDIRGSSNRIGIAQIFGDSPRSMLNDLKKVQYEKVKRQPTKEKEVEGLMTSLLGEVSGTYSPTLASIGLVTRSLTSIARLGKIAINSLSDISQLASMSQRMGYGYWGAYVRGIAGQLQLLNSETRRLLAKQMHLRVNAQIGFIGTYAEASSASDISSKFSNTFYYATGMRGWDLSLKTSAIVDLANNLGRDSSKAWMQLNEQTKYYLEKFNINENEWEVLRTKSKNNLFTLDNINDLSDSEVKALWEKSDKEIPLSQYRSQLNRKFYGLFDTVTENTVLDPGAYERMITTGNQPAGTILGEVTRMATQFWSYPIANFRRVWYGGMADMQGGQAKLLYALNMAAGSFMLGYLSKVLDNFASGKTTENFTNFELKDWAALLAPGMGTFLRIMDPKNQNSKLLTNMMFTPSVHVMGDIISGSVGLATGNIKGAKKNMQDLARYANPIGTVPFFQPYFDAMLGKKPYLAKGQKQIYGA